MVGWHWGKPPEGQIGNEDQPRDSGGKDRTADSSRQRSMTIVLTLILIARLLMMCFPQIPFL